MSKYIVDNIVGLYGVFVSTDKELIVSCNRKENAELIANILNADRDGGVYGTVDGSPSLLAHLLNVPQQRVKITKEEAERMIKDDAEQRKTREQEYNEQRIDNIEERIKCLENAFRDCQKKKWYNCSFVCVCMQSSRKVLWKMTEEKIFTVIDDIKELIRSTKRELKTCELCIKLNNRFATGAKRKTPILQQRIEILEKTLPMKVLNKEYDYREFDYTGNCPKCKNYLIQEYNEIHCGACGQALKWE